MKMGSVLSFELYGHGYVCTPAGLSSRVEKLTPGWLEQVFVKL